MANIGYAQLASGLTAIGTTQATGYPLIASSNFFTTVADGTGAVLNSAWSQSDSQLVYNGGANQLSVYPPSGSKINELTTNGAMLLPVNTSCKFVKSATTQWTGILSR